jgi:DNA modification methylase
MWLNQTHRGDCREFLPRMAADGVKVDACITSPPYYVEAYGASVTPAEYIGNLVSTFRLVREVLTEEGTLWLNLGDFGPKVGMPWMVAFALVEDGWLLNADVIWHQVDALRPPPGAHARRPCRTHEYLFMLNKSQHYRYVAEFNEDVLSVPLEPPTGPYLSFPGNLIIPCVLASVPFGGTVLDPFMGSGTTAKAATALGRNFIGCEIRPT